MQSCDGGWTVAFEEKPPTGHQAPGWRCGYRYPTEDHDVALDLWAADVARRGWARSAELVSVFTQIDGHYELAPEGTPISARKHVEGR